MVVFMGGIAGDAPSACGIGSPAGTGRTDFFAAGGRSPVIVLASILEAADQDGLRLRIPASHVLPDRDVELKIGQALCEIFLEKSCKLGRFRRRLRRRDAD